jgi:hypothetical protein
LTSKAKPLTRNGKEFRWREPEREARVARSDLIEERVAKLAKDFGLYARTAPGSTAEYGTRRCRGLVMSARIAVDPSLCRAA